MTAINISAVRNPVTGKIQGSYDPTGYIIVMGSGFGTKPYSAPITWETFNGTNGQLVSAYKPEWVPYAGDGALITDANPRFSGHKSAYNDPTRNPDPMSHSQFWTNSKTTLSRKSRTRFASYWVRVNHRAAVEDGQVKFSRIGSSAASGGGGVYSGAGVHLLNAPTTDSWALGWYSLTPDARNKYLDAAWYPANRWVRIEYEVYLSDLDTPNGIYNVHVIGYGSKTFSGVMQRETGYGADCLLDSVLLGLETANPEKWVTPNVLTPSTTYTVTVVSSGTTYNGSYTSGGSSPTAAEIIGGLEASLLVAGLPPVIIHTNPANTGEIGFYWNTTVTWNANMSRATPISVQQSETYEDDDFKRFYIANADTWAASTESNPQPYAAWTDTAVQLRKYVGGITGRTWLYKQLTPNTTPIRVGEVVGDSIIYG